MPSYLVNIANSIGRGYLFTRLTRYINPELLSSLMFFGVLLASDFFSNEFLEDFSNAIIIEFLMIHANVGLAVGLMFSDSQKSQKRIILIIAAFYSMFIIAIAISINAWWVALVFLFLVYSRMYQPFSKGNRPKVMGELIVTMLRFAVYMVSAIIVIGLMDDNIGLIIWGGIYFLTLFLLRNAFKKVYDFASSTM